MVTVEEYSRTVQVASYEVGANEKIKLSVLLRMAQEECEHAQLILCILQNCL